MSDGAGVPASRFFAQALVVLVALFAGALAVGQVIVPPTNSIGSPSGSRLRLAEDVFPPRHLTAREISRGGPTCLQGTTLVVSPDSGCTFILPEGVHVVVFRRVPGSPGLTVTLTQTGDLTQNVDTGAPGPDPSDPLRFRFATVHDQATVTLSGCRGPGSCRLDVAA